MNCRLIASLLLITVLSCHRHQPSASNLPKATLSDEQTTAIDSDLPDYTEQKFERPLTRDIAIEILSRTEIFADTHIGVAGVKSVQVEAFQLLLREPDALEIFKELRERGRMAGHLYALCGLRIVAPEQYAAVEPSYVTSEQLVKELSGCVMSWRPVKDIVRSTEPNAVRLRPGETIAHWFERSLPPDSGAIFDIAGGAIPRSFQAAK